MISRTEKTVILFLLGVILIGSAIFCFTRANSYIYEYLTQGSRDNCGEITEGITIVQDLPYEKGDLGYSFLISTYGHDVSGDLFVRGIGKQTGTVYIEKTIPGSDLQNNVFVDFFFPEDIPTDSETIAVIITSSSDPTSGLTVLTTGVDSLLEYRFFINYEETARDLVTRRIRMPKNPAVIRSVGVLAVMGAVFSLFIMMKAPLQLKERFLKAVQIFVILFFFSIVLYLIHKPMALISDDMRNIASTNGASLDAVKIGFTSRYYGNGRFLTDTLAFVLYLLPFSWWKIFDIGAYNLLLFQLWTLFTDRTLKMLTVCAVLIVLFPIFSYMESAGFIATSANYFYTIIALLFGISPLVQIFKNKKNIPVFLFVISAIGLIYAANQDQTAVIEIAVFLFAAVASGIRLKIDHDSGYRRMFIGSVIYLFLSLLLFVFMLRNPGHIVRVKSTNEMNAYLPQFANWNIAFKFYKGLTTTFSYVFFSNLTLFRIYCLVLMGVVFVHAREKVIYPSMLIAALVFIQVMNEDHKFILYPSYGFGLPDFDQFHKCPESFYLSILIVLLILFSIIVLWRPKRDLCWILLGLLAVGFGSRVMMGFSPTLFASSFRTFTPLLYSLIISIILMVGDLVRFISDTDSRN